MNPPGTNHGVTTMTNDESPICHLSFDIRINDKIVKSYGYYPVLPGEDLVKVLMDKLENTPYKFGPHVEPYVEVLDKNNTEGAKYQYRLEPRDRKKLQVDREYYYSSVDSPKVSWAILLQNFFLACGKNIEFGLMWSKIPDFKITLHKKPTEVPVKKEEAPVAPAVYIPDVFLPFLELITKNWNKEKTLLENLRLQNFDLCDIHEDLFVSFGKFVQTPNPEDLSRLFRFLVGYSYMRSQQNAKQAVSL